MKFAISLLLFLALFSRSALAAPDYSWGEAETPAAANFTFETSSPKADLLSGGKSMQKEVKKTIWPRCPPKV